MALRAVDDVTEAFQATKAFLTPVDTIRWAKLAFVAFFLWGTAWSGSSSSDGSGGGTETPGTSSDIEVSFEAGSWSVSSVPIEGFGSIDGALLAAILALGAVVFLLGVAYLFVGSVMEFVFIESLRSEAVAVRAYWREHRRRGARLFAFRLVFFFGLIVLFAGLFALVIVPVFLNPDTVFLAPVALIVLFPVLLCIGLGAVVVNEFTTVFIVPIMMIEGCGVLAAWRRLWRAVRAEPAEFLAYAGLKFVLSIVAGAIVGAVIAIPTAVLFLPVGALGGILALTNDPSILVVLGVVALGVLAIAVLFALTALLQVPLVTYFRYYALLFLGDVDADLDLVPGRRAAIRETQADDGE